MGVAIIKYNAGNVRSVDYALRRLGVEAVVTADESILAAADRIIFPGVGEAETTMKHLRETGLDRIIVNLTRPVLGICVGMQLMCRSSEEGGGVECMGIFDAPVRKFVPARHEDKVPHMGWNSLSDTRSPLFRGFPDNAFVYFVHSYYVPLNPDTIARADYIDPFSAAMRKDNFYAVQFHPEKSGAAGQLVLRNFLEL